MIVQIYETFLERSVSYHYFLECRFNGAFHTMNAFFAVFDELAGILDRTILHDYTLIDKDLQDCSFLAPFKEEIKGLSSD